MTSEKRIADAVLKATRKYGQGEELSNKILAWFAELAKGNTSFLDKDAERKFVEQLYDATVVASEDSDDEEEQGR